MTEVEPHVEALPAERYRDLFELAPVSTLVTESNGLILEANRAAAELFGVAPGRLIGKPITVFIPVQHRKQFRKTLLGLAGDRKSVV